MPAHDGPRRQDGGPGPPRATIMDRGDGDEGPGLPPAATLNRGDVGLGRSRTATVNCGDGTGARSAAPAKLDRGDGTEYRPAARGHTAARGRGARPAARGDAGPRRLDGCPIRRARPRWTALYGTEGPTRRARPRLNTATGRGSSQPGTATMNHGDETECPARSASHAVPRPRDGEAGRPAARVQAESERGDGVPAAAGGHAGSRRRTEGPARRLQPCWTAATGRRARPAAHGHAGSRRGEGGRLNASGHAVLLRRNGGPGPPRAATVNLRRRNGGPARLARGHWIASTGRGPGPPRAATLDRRATVRGWPVRRARPRWTAASGRRARLTAGNAGSRRWDGGPARRARTGWTAATGLGLSRRERR